MKGVNKPGVYCLHRKCLVYPTNWHPIDPDTVEHYFPFDVVFKTYGKCENILSLVYFNNWNWTYQETFKDAKFPIKTEQNTFIQDWRQHNKIRNEFMACLKLDKKDVKMFLHSNLIYKSKDGYEFQLLGYHHWNWSTYTQICIGNSYTTTYTAYDVYVKVISIPKTK